MWVSLASINSLQSLDINESSVAFHLSHPSLQSVKDLQVSSLSSCSYKHLLALLPGLARVGYPGNPIFLTRPDEDIANIADGLQQSKSSLTAINLDGEYAKQRVVSDTSMRSLCEVIRDHSATLENFWLWRVAINEAILVTVVETCRAITTLKNIECV